MGIHLRDDADKLCRIKPSLMFIHFRLFFVLQLVRIKEIISLCDCFNFVIKCTKFEIRSFFIKNKAFFFVAYHISPLMAHCEF